LNFLRLTAVLQHQFGERARPKLSWADRALIALLLGLIARLRYARTSLIVTPGAILRWRCDLLRCSWVDKSKPNKGTGEAAMSEVRKVLTWAPLLTGAGDKIGFCTPNFDPIWAGAHEQPDFTVGVNILRFGPGIAPGSGPGDGTHVHMYVKNNGNLRNVQLVAQHGMTDARLAAKLVTRFLDSFRAADPGLRVTETNI
jgi:hypothetical protein